MHLPNQLIASLKNIEGFDAQSFESVHESPEQITSLRLNPLKPIAKIGVDDIHRPVPWTQYGFYLTQRPSFTFDPLFHAGCYYVQEASSMFLEQALKQTVDLSKPIKVLDLCAAPGGKSTHIQSLISKDSLLISNEVIKSRANVLKDNMVKWGSENVVVTNNDPKDFGRLEDYFDVIVIDAPCSGSGLFRRDEEAMDEWSVNSVALCSQRQQRILSDVWPALKKDGILIYSTCSYSKEEDEDILDWIGAQFSVSSLQLTVADNWNISQVRSNSGCFGYRFWPYKIKGEGFFIGCFQKKEGGEEFICRIKNKAERLTNKESAIVQSWLSVPGRHLFKHNNEVYSLTSTLQEEINVFISSLRVLYSGVVIGELFNDKLVPAHSLALSDLVNQKLPAIDVDKEQAIRYLQKKEFNSDTKQQGWHLVKFEGFNLGWVKILANRINNYYPKELRILKDI